MLRGEIDAANKKTRELIDSFIKETQTRITDLKTLVWTHFQTAEKRHSEAMAQITQRLTGIEAMLTEMRSDVDDIRRQLTDNATTSSKRLDDLQSEYWRQRQSDEQQRAEQTKTLSDRLTAVERDSGDLRRALSDGHRRLADLEGAYWSNREKDQRQRDEQTKNISDKLAMFDRQVVDVAHELREVQHDLKRANDLNHAIHQMEMRQDERRIAAEESKRGPQGLPGPKGPKGDTGPAGKAGRDGRDAPTVKTKKWEIKAAEFTAREILSDGSRMPALNLRPLFEEYQRQVGE